MNPNATVPPWGLYIACAVIFGFLIWTAVKEFRAAKRKDESEKTTKYLSRKIKEYALIGVLCLVAGITVIQLKGGPLKGLSERIWGSQPQPTVTSPFYGDFGK